MFLLPFLLPLRLAFKRSYSIRHRQTLVYTKRISKSIEEYTDSIMCPPLDSQVASDPVVDAETVQERAGSETPSQKRPNACMSYQLCCDVPNAYYAGPELTE